MHCECLPTLVNALRIANNQIVQRGLRINATIALRMLRMLANAYKWACKRYKWNESGIRPPLCTYRLNWARRTSWGWWDDWDDTVLQTQDSKFEPWRSEAEHATSRSRSFPTILTCKRYKSTYEWCECLTNVTIALPFSYEWCEYLMTRLRLV